jgi:uncharacterized cupredoxin-like copper-binding protein
LKRIVMAGALVATAALMLFAGAASARHEATTVGVKMSEFKFVLTTKTVAKGVVTFKLSNVGTIPHDFKINGKKTPLVAPKQSTTLKVTFIKAGKYPYICTVPGHAAAGMKGVLTVR